MLLAKVSEVTAPTSSEAGEAGLAQFEIKEALAHADKGGRNGKILVSPNGVI